MKPCRLGGPPELIERIDEDHRGLVDGYEQRLDLRVEFVVIVLPLRQLGDDATVRQIRDDGDEERAHVRRRRAGPDEAADHRHAPPRRLGLGNSLRYQGGLAEPGRAEEDQRVSAVLAEVARNGREVAVTAAKDAPPLQTENAAPLQGKRPRAARALAATRHDPSVLQYACRSLPGAGLRYAPRSPQGTPRRAAHLPSWSPTRTRRSRAEESAVSPPPASLREVLSGSRVDIRQRA